MIHFRTPNRTCKPSAFSGKSLPLLRKMLLASLVLGIGGAGNGGFIDAVTAATSTAIPAPPPPNLVLQGSPAIVNNKISAAPGQTVTITATAIDPLGYSTIDVAYGNLPATATFQTPQDAAHGIFSWTPAAGTASANVQFAAQNYYWQTQSAIQTVTIAVVGPSDNQAPSFDASIPLQQSAMVGEKLSFPVTVNPDGDDDKVTLSASGLPKGAKLGAAVKNAATGKWKAILTWIPTSAQAGQQFAVDFIAKDDSFKPAQTSYAVTFNVQAAPVTPTTVKAINITQGQWNAKTQTLKAGGTVSLNQKAGAATPLEVTLAYGNSAGTAIAMKTITIGKGKSSAAWSFSQTFSATTVPCEIRVTETSSTRSALYAVKKAPKNTCQ